MNELDLQPLVDMAVIIDQEEREMSACETNLTLIEHGADTATPASLEKRLRDLGQCSDRTKMPRWVTPTLWQKLCERIERQTDHPEVMALMGKLLTQAHELKSRLIRVRRRIRDLEMVLVGATRDLQQQSLDGRLLRLIGDEPRSMTAIEIHEEVEKDHAAVADAIATWKLSNGAGAVLSIREGNTREEVVQALRRLERTGHASHTGFPFATMRWTVHRTPGENRLRA